MYAQERLGVKPRNVRRPRSSASLLSISRVGSSSYSGKELDRRLLRHVHTTCIEEPIDALCEILGGDETAEDRVADALERVNAAGNGEAAVDVSPDQIAELLDSIVASFTAISRSLSRSLSSQRWISDYNPDWKTRNLVWSLVHSLGRIAPPDSGDGAQLFQLVKATCFAAMFRGDYIMQQRENSSFRSTLMRHLPKPGAWDADTGWLGIAFFISIPLASSVHSFGDGHRVLAFWSTFCTIFFCTSICMVLGYAKYTSWYATRLLDSAAARIPLEALGSGGYDDPGDSETQSGLTGYEAGTDTDGGDGLMNADGVEEVRIQFAEAAEEDGEEQSEGDALLRLYQVSMLVERLHSSFYFDDASMLIGLSEEQVFTAMETILNSDSALGKQFAAFSFTAVAISSRGAALGASDLAPGVQFSFSVFSLLGAAGFLCGLTSSVMADLMLRQLSMTQTKEENTGHYFAAQFGSFLRLNGGLNGFAACFLATAVFHFMVSIFQVSLWVALPLGALWLVGGSVAVESFLASYSYWQLSEVFDDLGEVVEPPILQSPSPVTGSIQIVARHVRRIWNKLSRSSKRD